MTIEIFEYNTWTHNRNSNREIRKLINCMNSAQTAKS